MHTSTVHVLRAYNVCHCVIALLIEGLVLVSHEAGKATWWLRGSPPPSPRNILLYSPTMHHAFLSYLHMCSAVHIPVLVFTSFQLHLSSSTGPALTDVSLSINAPLPLTTHPSFFSKPEVSSTHKVEPLLVTVVCTPSLLPSTTALTVSATYKSPNGKYSRVHTCTCIQ